MTDVVWPSVEAVPSQMTAVTIRQFGGPDVLHVETVAVPHVQPGEVLVCVAAASVGRLLDVVARSGKHPFAKISFPHIFGADHAGVVVRLGEGVTDVEVGDRVAVFPVVVPQHDEMRDTGTPELSASLQIIGTHRPGAYARYVSVPAENVTKVPAGLSPDDAAALALSGAVAMNQFVQVGGVGPGSRVVVQGATSALGSTTALLALHLGATVIVTSRSAAKRARLRQLGFEHILDATASTFAESAQAVFEGRGAHLIIDNVGDRAVWERGFLVLATGGVVVSSGAFLGHQLSIDLASLYIRGQRIIGVRTGNLASVALLWREVEKGFRTVVDTQFPLSEAQDAHRYVEGGGNVGRVVLVP